MCGGLSVSLLDASPDSRPVLGIFLLFFVGLELVRWHRDGVAGSEAPPVEHEEEEGSESSGQD